jgi:TldD protein
MEERDFIEKALQYAIDRSVDYADVRYIPISITENISVKNGVVENLEYAEHAGFGIRVLIDGCWGFASSFRIEEKEVFRVLDLAIKIAKASALTRQHSVQLSTALTWKSAKYVSPVEIDPFKVSLDEKVDLLVRADGAIRQESKKIKITECDLSFNRVRKIFSSTEGSYITQEITVSGGGISAKAVEGNEVQVRSYPNSFRGNYASRGYEFIESMDLLQHAPRIAKEAEELLSAPECPEMETDIILMPSQLCLQIHESVGHAVELDRILGTEITYAGGSFLTPLLNQIGNFQYASPLVNITADAALEGGLGSFGFDDEGIEAQKFPVIENGILKNLLTSRETVAEVNKKLGKEFFASSNGTMRASFANRIPLIRMTNLYMEPGETEYAELIESTRNGMLLDTNFSWSIDDVRLNFSFGLEVAREIKNGKIGKLYRNTLYTGMSPTFWNSCDAVCNRKHWEVYGTPNCGKGQPGQIMSVGHGAAPARFRNVKVGSRKK